MGFSAEDKGRTAHRNHDLGQTDFYSVQDKVQVIRSDNEFISQSITEHLQESGIKPEYSPPNEKDFVGIAERTNRTMNEAVRCMLHQAKMPKTM
jgi:hypothetical protein